MSGATDKEERLVTAALSRAAAVPLSPLAALLASEKAPVDDRARAARVLGTLDDARAAEVLIGALGTRPRAAAGGGRAARLGTRPSCPARRCWRRSPPDRTTAAPREADLLRALPAVVKRDPARRAEALGSLRAALAPERSFEVRGRAVMALGTLGARGRSGGAGPAAREQRRSGAALPGDARAGGADPGGRRRRSRAPPCAARSPTAIRACARPRRWRWASWATSNPRPGADRRAPSRSRGRSCGAPSWRRSATCARPAPAISMLRAIAQGRRRGAPGRAGRRWSAARTSARATVLLQDRRAARTRRRPCASWRRRCSANRATTTRRRSSRRRCARLVNEAEADLALEGVAATALRALARLGGPDAVGAGGDAGRRQAPPLPVDRGRGAGHAVRSGRGPRRRCARSRSAPSRRWRSPRRTPRSTAAGGRAERGPALTAPERERRPPTLP